MRRDPEFFFWRQQQQQEAVNRCYQIRCNIGDDDDDDDANVGSGGDGVILRPKITMSIVHFVFLPR